MSTSDARHGRPDKSRRDNGLVAAEYAAAGDVDPRVGEHLLDVLALDGIAAYLRPSTDLHPITRQTSLPARPTDRLYVDRVHLAAAQAYLTKLAAEARSAEEDDAAASAAAAGLGATAPTISATSRPGSDPDVDAEWARIVAEYDAEAADPERSWPAAEDVDRGDRTGDLRDSSTERPQSGTDRSGVDERRPEGATQPSLLDGLDTFGAGLADDEEGFTPPAPPPVPRPSLPAVLAVIGILGGLLLFLKPALVPFAESTSMVLGFLAIVAGSGTLVWRLRPGDDEDDIDPDDGARV